VPASQDILLSARLVHTGTTDPANAILVRDGVIVAVGDRTALRRASPDARLIDLAGATLTPGLIDAHVHLTEWALTRDMPDLSASTSPAHAASILANSVAKDRTGWIRGRGWSAHDWNGAAPDAQTLDAIFPDLPVALQSHDMHSLWVNSAALRAIGVGRNTPDPNDGRIVRDAHGEPTGLLLETAAEMVLSYVPVPTDQQAMDAVAAGQAQLHRYGFTGVHSFPGIHIPVPDPFTVLQKLYEGDVLRLRILQHFAREKLDSAIEIGIRSGFGSEWLRIGGVKLFLDGALGSRTAWMREPYEGSDQTGVNVLGRDELRDIVRRAAAAGIAATVHAIGDAAVSLAIDELSGENVRVKALPHRIEHVQCCPPERLPDFARHNIVCSVQPCHLMSDWAAADRHWGRRGANTYPFRSLLEHGAVLAFGSDAPVEPIDPRRGLFAAVTRQDDARQPADGWYPEQRISARAALDAFTTGPAFAAGTQGIQGILQAGAWADVAAWNTDPLDMDPDDLTKLRCIATMVGGELVFS
jgi:predicted amidohydrolase YtcJ